MATHHEISEHKLGEMDITAQRKTFAGFIRMTTWVSGIAIVVLIFLALSNA
ncbi:aa3-type cytochrome c oxidase subunit IV [Paracoccus seriniphilus]|uniref:Aa3 type cytochrome c oxidase subunit IV n=1 Tax=Paracoccus seriniphilus TaxID=184748 RepID=A0A239PRT5_9RHOB|nr:aa3-type cytochrome c oxidase subunit IV [Paracoccus seriniphilus]WCR14308.1 aa3-type cytochrome c oxidase subunit IV [Paracoccus seriniphilus]SNT72985.1 aa3 type cytochrome c oxidase subunit IV [Paracoccus seriniphilus]